MAKKTKQGMKKPTKLRRWIVITHQELFSTEYLALMHADHMTVPRPGKPSKAVGWDYVTRKKGGKNAVQVIAKDDVSGKLLMIKQFRIPVNKFVISFPSGLIDDGETVKESAKRELEEETGYGWDRVISVSPITPKSAGLTDEGGATVVCIVDKGKIGKQKLQDNEAIEYFWQTPAAFMRSLKDLPADTVAEGGVYAYCSAFLQGVITCMKRETV